MTRPTQSSSPASESRGNGVTMCKHRDGELQNERSLNNTHYSELQELSTTAAHGDLCTQRLPNDAYVPASSLCYINNNWLELTIKATF